MNATGHFQTAPGSGFRVCSIMQHCLDPQPTKDSESKLSRAPALASKIATRIAAKDPLFYEPLRVSGNVSDANATSFPLTRQDFAGTMTTIFAVRVQTSG